MSTDNPATAGLPPSYLQLAPELGELDPPREQTADCGNCPMVAQPDEPDPPQRMVFNATLRCCTYNPVLYNFLVGRILRRGGAGAESVRRRMSDLDGVNRWAIRPSQAFYDQVDKQPRGGFGVDVARKCPYWGPDPAANCTIWEDRNAVCRAWFCQHDEGLKGRNYWDSLRDLLWILQVKLARWLVDSGAPPDPATADQDDWCAFYVDCAERLDRATADEIAALDDDGLAAARDRVRACWVALQDDGIPEILGPAITAFYDIGDAVMLEGYSHYSPTTWPKGVWALLSQMDGTVTWSDALDRAEAALGDRVFTETHIRDMVRLGILEARVPEDLVPGVRLRGGSADRVGALDDVAFEWPFEGME